MKNESLYFSEHEKNADGHGKAYASEELTFNVTEDLLIIMEDKDITKSDLAEKLGKTKSYVSQLLSGSKNMTLKTMSDVCFALGIKPVVEFQEQDNLTVSDNFIKSFSHIGWEAYCADDQGQDIDEGGTEIVSKSNIVYKPKHFWERAAA